ncbi:hypothetical protein PUN28_019233 [Cardiocondyla obscurior]|uniref:Secreted protein n=1 Tax=Cardiocondyla obscurior TaxID=286306 RepID=A0AAW2EFY5_9HYME
MLYSLAFQPARTLLGVSHVAADASSPNDAAEPTPAIREIRDPHFRPRFAPSYFPRKVVRYRTRTRN